MEHHEITYDMIIKYLVKTERKDPFITKKSIFCYADNFPDKFKELFTDKFYRYGVTIFDKETIPNNISFWSSVLTLLDKNFMIQIDNDDIVMINEFKNQLLEHYPKRHHIDKIDMREHLKLNPDNETIYYICKVLGINVIIFNFETIEFSSIHVDTKLNPWKPTLLLAQYGVNWEPIMNIKSKGTTQRTFDYNDSIMRKILENLNFYDDINEIVSQEKKKLKNKNVPVDVPTIPTEQVLENNHVKEVQEVIIDDGEVKTDDEEMNVMITMHAFNYTKSQINKMKLGELMELGNKLKVDIGKRPTRATLIDLILSNLKL